MDQFDFEELVADMLGMSDEQREDESHMENMFYEKFDMDMEHGFELAKALLPHTPKVLQHDSETAEMMDRLCGPAAYHEFI